MSIEQVYKIVPHEFVLACHTVKVVVEEFVYDPNENSLYGDWNDVTCTIRIATHVEEEGEHELTEEQVRNSFYHEMFHAFMFFSGLKQDEMIVQSFANFLREYETSKK